MIRNILSCKTAEELQKIGSLKEIKQSLASLLPPSATLNADTYESLLPTIQWFAVNEEKTFTNIRQEHIYYLLGHNNGKERKNKLHIDDAWYQDNGARAARAWRNKIAHILRADVYLDEKTRSAYQKLDELYKEMVQLEVDEPLPYTPPTTSGDKE
ncbi:hypothetical protein JGC56_04265 [Salmonella enterica subsp. enterica serovar Saintpaul]|nr:hypothetical protein [Salmonella enterica subsp. enterica serovar Saintpaul]